MLLLYLRLLTLVQFLHDITAVHKTDDEDTLDSLVLKEKRLAILIACAEYVVEFTGTVSRPKIKLQSNIVSNFSFSSWL